MIAYVGLPGRQLTQGNPTVPTSESHDGLGRVVTVDWVIMHGIPDRSPTQEAVKCPNYA